METKVSGYIQASRYMQNIYRVCGTDYPEQVLYLSEGTDAKERKENYMTVPAAIRELEKIELIRQSDREYRMDYAVTATQKEILKAFNMTAANIRTQASVMNEDLMKIEKEG